MLQTAQFSFSNIMAAAQAAGTFSSLATIQSPSQAPDSIGYVDLIDWTTVAGMASIPCMLAPQSVARTNQNDERKSVQQIAESTEFHCLLNAYFPAILQRYRAVVDGVAYDIMSVEHDSQAQMTRLALRRYSL